MSKHSPGRIDPEGSNIVHYMRAFVAACDECGITPSRELLLAAPEMLKALEAWNSNRFAMGSHAGLANLTDALLAKIDGEEKPND